MNTQEKLAYVKNYQSWWCGNDDVPAPYPATLGHVLDYAIECCERCERMDADDMARSVHTTGADVR